MRTILLACIGLGLGGLVAVGYGCSGKAAAGFGSGKDGGRDGTTSGDAWSLTPTTDSSSVSTGCTGLACQQTNAATSVSGKVYDPAGINGLYNVFVYVPNAALTAIASGPTCEQCQAPASGDPITSTSTLADGTFVLKNVPSGTDIPIVLQLGKWRRHLTLPSVAEGQTTTPADGFFRLPKKQAESSPDDNIPLIAFTTGCDAAECFFVGRVGLDPTEVTGPTGTGRVHIYRSKNDDGQTFPNGNGAAATLWATASEWMKYDIVFDACECDTYNRGTSNNYEGYANFLSYLNAGGRAFTTHYFYNFFADTAQCGGGGLLGNQYCYGQSPLPTIGAWEKNTGRPMAAASNCPKDSTLGSGSGYGYGTSGGSCMTIDTSIPKGVAFAQWYQDNNAKLTMGGGEKYGYVGLTDIRADMGALESSLVTAGTATPWLYAGDLTSKYDAYYFSVNTPVGTDAGGQCGRAIFSDVHVDSAPSGGAFPGYCPSDPNANDHAPNELALEFLFFDLSSCVQNDTQAPPPPPPAK